MGDLSGEEDALSNRDIAIGDVLPREYKVGAKIVIIEFD
jgi:hypothetical protein